MDTTARALYGLAMAALAAIVLLYLYEVAARYLFNAPTTWTGEAVQYSLAAVIFLALPEATRRRAHICVDILPELLAPSVATWLMRATVLAAALACLYAAWIVAGQAQVQAARALMTNAAHPVPRWWFSAVIALGLAGAGLELLREMVTRRAA